MKRFIVVALLKNWKSYPKATHKKGKRILELASINPIVASQHVFGFIPTTTNQIQI